MAASRKSPFPDESRDADFPIGLLPVPTRAGIRSTATAPEAAALQERPASSRSRRRREARSSIPAPREHRLIDANGLQLVQPAATATAPLFVIPGAR